MLRPAFAFILIFAASHAGAEPVAHQNANGASATPQNTIQAGTVAPSETAPNASETQPEATSAPSTVKSPSSSTQHPSPRVRWHSFLPGMMK